MARPSSRVKCIGCGRRLWPGQRFCSSCGASQAPTEHAPTSLLGSDDAPEDRRLVSVLFARLGNIAELGEQVDPEVLRYIVASVDDAIRRNVERYGGTLSKLATDQVAALFGAPLGHDDDAERAIRSALDMGIALDVFNGELSGSHAVQVQLSIGIDTGEVVAGTLSINVTSTYSVMGDTVNLARALASAAEPGQVLVGPLAHRLAERAFEAERLPPIAVDDRAEPVAAYRILTARVATAPLRATAPLIGRAGELTYLHGALAHVRRATGLCVTVVGEAGVGKTRLLGEFRSELPADVPQILARCASFETDTPYALIGALLRSAFQIQAGETEIVARQQLTRGLSQLNDAPSEAQLSLLLTVLGFGEQFPFNPESRRPILLMTLRQLLGRATADAPLVVVVEDVHWADAASTAVMADLALEIGSRACLVIATTRTGWTAPWVAEHLELQPLDEAHARELIGHLVGADAVGAMADAVLQRTGGNPFFLEEVVHELSSDHPASETNVPASVHEIIQARLDRLPRAAKRVVHAAAVCGTTFSKALLEQVVGSADLPNQLALLARERLIVPASMGEEGDSSFRHALVQEVAYRAQLKSKLRVRHRAVASALERLYADRLDEVVSDLAFHYARSDDNGKAVQWLVRAGDRARALFANSEALNFYAAALKRATDGPGPLDAAAILERSAEIHTLTGKYEAAISNLREALQRAPGTPPDSIARLHRKIGVSLTHMGSFAHAAVAFDSAEAVLGAAETTESAWACLQRGHLDFRRGEYGQARLSLDRAVEIAISVGAIDVLAEAFKQLGNLAAETGNLASAIESYTYAREHYAQREDLLGLADIHSNTAIVHRRRSEWDGALHALNTALSLRERIGYMLGIGNCHNNIGEVYRSQGLPSAALEAFQRAHEIYGAIGSPLHVALAEISIAAARLDLGYAKQARADLVHARSLLADVGTTQLLPELYAYLAQAELATGDVHAAGRAAEESLAFSKAAGAPNHEAFSQRVLAQVAIARSEFQVARDLLECSQRTLAKIGDNVEFARTQAVLEDLAAASETRD